MKELIGSGLVVKSPWIDLILAGKKTWEIRGSNTSKRGDIFLIRSGSGLVVGKVELVGVRKLTLNELYKYEELHCISKDKLNMVKYKNIYAWELRNVKTFDKPIRYEHPKGAVIWVNLNINRGIVK